MVIKVKATVFNIQRYSVQDGPGIRTTVFFKGCPLDCLWCSNPESKTGARELAHNSRLCIGCDKCVAICPAKAISVSKPDHQIAVNRQLCDVCGKCVDVCHSGALKVYGDEMPVKDIVDEVMRDIAFYRNSNGGVTASGGEPLLQARLVRELFRQCKEAGLHTCLDTTGYASRAHLESVLEFTDLVYYDLKHMDSSVHKSVTGVGNELILANLSAIAGRDLDIVIRIPLVSGINDSAENLGSTAEFVRHIKGAEQIEVNILPYHRFAIGKYQSLDLAYRLGELPALNPDAPRVLQAKEIIESAGLVCRIEI